MNSSPNHRFAAVSLAFAALVLSMAAAAANDAMASPSHASPRPAAKLRLAHAERVAGEALAPLGVQAAHCFRPVPANGRSALRRAFCLVAHPAPPGEMCNSLIYVWTPRSDPGAVLARVIRLQVCMPVPQPAGG
jgi:hypothetical protein